MPFTMGDTKGLSTNWPTIQPSWLIQIGISWVNPLTGKFLLLNPPKKILLNRKGPRIHLNFKSFKLNHVEKKTTKKQQLQFFGKEQCENDLTLTVVTERRLTPLYRALSEPPVGFAWRPIVEMNLCMNWRWHRDAKPKKQKNKKQKRWFRGNSSIFL